MRFPGWAYDLLMLPLELLFLRRMRRRLLSGLPARTLELGAGTGANLARRPQGSGLLVAVDPNLTFLESAKKHAQGMALVCARAEELPFRPHSFEAVVETLVFCSVRDPDAALAEARRVLVPGGQMRMLDHVRAPGRILGWLQDRLTPGWSRVFDGCRLNREIYACVERQGFRVERRDCKARGAIEELALRNL